MPYSAVFCDIDGTLLDDQHALRPATAAAVRALHAGGTPFVLVSARSPGGVYGVQEQLGIDGPVVCYGGALVLDAERQPAHSLGIPMERVAALKRRAVSIASDIIGTVYAFDNWYVDDDRHPSVVAEARITGAVPTRTSTDELLERGDRAHKVFCIGRPDDILVLETAIAEENPDLAVVKSSPIFLEIMHGDATKANAMAFLCRELGLPLSAVVAFGDNYNDVDMLEAAGLGIAMGNAPEAVRAKADQTTADSNHDGVAQALGALAPWGSGSTPTAFSATAPGAQD